jgi:hypothetical protein
MPYALLRDEMLRQLARCDEHLAATDRNIFDQQKRVEALELAGRDASFSKTLLATFKRLRQSHLDHRDILVCSLQNNVRKRFG